MPRRVALLATILLCACSGHQLKVNYLPQPTYPEEALDDNIQGTVTVTACFGTDGKVISASGVGPNPILVKAAEENLRQWIFGGLSSRGEYPMCHTVDYRFVLEGKPFAGISPTLVRTDLPDRLEVVARPFLNDNPPSGLVPRKPTEQRPAPHGPATAP